MKAFENVVLIHECEFLTLTTASVSIWTGCLGQKKGTADRGRFVVPHCVKEEEEPSAEAGPPAFNRGREAGVYSCSQLLRPDNVYYLYQTSK